MAATKAGGKRRFDTICAALKHPIRLRILEVLDEGPRSPSQFVDEGLVPSDLYETHHQALSLVSYHFRQLQKDGVLEIVETIPRRGVVEHIYRSLGRVYLTDGEFAELPQERREELSRSAIQGLIARADNALRAGTFDRRADRHLAWMPLQLDRRGWDEFKTALASCFGEVEQIRHDAATRLNASGDEVMPVTFGMLGFESPPPPPVR